MARVIIEQHVEGPGTYPNYPFKPGEENDVVEIPGLNQDNVSSYSSFAAAVSAIGSADRELVVAKPVTVSSNLTVPRNIFLTIKPGAVISVDTGCVLTLNCSIHAGLYQIFGGEGSVVNTKTGLTTVVYPEWFGAVGDFSSYADYSGATATDDLSAIQAAVNFFENEYSSNGGAVLFGCRGYKCSGQLTVPSNVALLGQSGSGRRFMLQGTVLAHRPTSAGNFIVSDVSNVGDTYVTHRIENLTILGDYRAGLTNYSQSALYLKRFSGRVSSVSIRNFQIGAKLEYTINAHFEHVNLHVTNKCLIVQGAGGSEIPGSGTGPSTSLSFTDCYFSQAEDNCITIVDTTDATFTNCITESNESHVYCLDGAEVRLINPYFEDNAGHLVYAGSVAYMGCLTVTHALIIGGATVNGYTDFFWLDRVRWARIEIGSIVSGTKASYIRTTANTGPVYFVQPGYPDGGISLLGTCSERQNNTSYSLGDKFQVDDENSYKTPKAKINFVCVQAGTTGSSIPSGYTYAAIDIQDGTAKFSCALPISAGGGLDNIHVINSGYTADARALYQLNAIRFHSTAGETKWEVGCVYGNSRDEFYLHDFSTHFLAIRASGHASYGSHMVLFGDSSELSTTHRLRLKTETEICPTENVAVAGLLINRSDVLNHGIGFLPDGQLDVGSSTDQRPRNVNLTGRVLFAGSLDASSLPGDPVVGQLAYFSNGDSGQPCLAFYNGTSWLRITPGSAVSPT